MNNKRLEHVKSTLAFDIILFLSIFVYRTARKGREGLSLVAVGTSVHMYVVYICVSVGR